MPPVSLSDEYRDPEDNGDGYFSGWNEEKRAYEGDSWLYKGGDMSRPQRDLTLQDPQCVFQKLKRHFSRYTPEMVEKVCGIPPDLFHKVAHALAAASGPERTAARLLRSWLDAAFQGRADHSHSCDSAIVAWKHWQAGRRDYGVARSCFDPGFH